MTELLSPAGGREALVAAVQNGADAVYMGFGSFNARRSARNFSDEEFLAAVRYCHLWGVKVYLTLNTLVTDRELPAPPPGYRSPGGNRGRRCFPGHRGNGFLRIPAGRNQQNSGNRRNRKPGSGKKQTISSLFHRRSPMYSPS